MFGHPPHMFGCLLYVWMMFGCLLYIYNTMKACFVRLRGCQYAPKHLYAPYVWMLPCMFGCSLYAWVLPYVWMHPMHVWMPPYVWMAACMAQCLHMFRCPNIWISSICLDAPCMFGHPHMFECFPVCLDAPICLDTPHMFGCPPVCLDDVWMPAVHIQHNKSMLCQTKGVSICPQTFVCPICLDAPSMFGCPLYAWMLPYVWMHPMHVWMPPYVWMAACMVQCLHMFGCPNIWMSSICLDAPVCLDTPHICLDAPLYVWMMFGCLLYIYNTTKACFVRLRGCPYAPNICMPHMFRCPLYVWMPLVCLDAPIC